MTRSVTVNTAESIAVDRDYYFDPDMLGCPLGVKVQLLNEGNVAVYGTVSSTTRNLWNGWAPMPRIRKEQRNGNGKEDASITVIEDERSDVGCNDDHSGTSPSADSGSHRIPNGPSA